MKRYLVCLTAGLAVLSVPFRTADAQRSTDISISRGAFAIAPYAGYLLSQHFFDGPLGTSLNVQSAPVYGLQIGLPLAPNASIVASAGYAVGDLDAGLPIIGGISVGETSTTAYDLSVELRLATPASRMVPVFQVGGGALRREVTVAGISAATTDFQVSGGIGADIPLSSNLSMRLMAKDYYGKADFGSVGALNARTGDLHTVALTGGIRFTF